MITFQLGVDDLASTRFALSPLTETVFSLRSLQDPARYAMHLPWRQSVGARLAHGQRVGQLDVALLRSLVGSTGFLPDFLTPRPARLTPTFDDELAAVRATEPDRVRRDLAATHAPDRLPPDLEPVTSCAEEPVLELLRRIGEALHRYWTLAIEPSWPQLRLVLEADIAYRARQLATGGARLLFADMHPNVRWRSGILEIRRMIAHHHVDAAGRGLLLMPCLFTDRPSAPLDPREPPWLAYPSRGVATLWTAPPDPDRTALAGLIGSPRATLLRMLSEPLPTVEMARRMAVTPSAISQHLRVLDSTGLVTHTRDGRHVLYRRSLLGDQLAADASATC